MRGVSKYFDGGDTVANYDVSLDVRDGEFLVLLGPSGCGKTTALRQIAGLETPSEGQILFDGRDMTDVGPSDRNVAMVFQDYALYPHLTVRENIEYPLKIRDVPPEERDERIAETAELLEIEDLLEKDPGELSGGQRQRTSLARAIVREPSVFLLDEPLSNLDAKLRRDMRSELKRLQSELDITTVYVTHNQTEAMSMADRIAVMNDGTVRQIDDPETLYDQPRSTWVADFIGSPGMNLLAGESSDGTIELETGESLRISSTSTGPVTLGFRPESLSVVADASQNGIEGVVDTVEPLGEFTLVTVDCGTDVLKAKVPETTVERGDSVKVTFEESDAYVYDEEGILVE
ncbi:MAG: ABC transporter ATP-binding protein [Halanaeroarchaeum sp.]